MVWYLQVLASSAANAIKVFGDAGRMSSSEGAAVLFLRQNRRNCFSPDEYVFLVELARASWEYILTSDSRC